MDKNILVIEDDRLNMRLLKDFLETKGYNIQASVDGVDTLQLAREHSPDLILMDIQLPEDSGIVHTKALKADPDLKNIPVIAVTAFTNKGDRERILEEGCDGYISKPIFVPEFYEEIQKFL